MCLTLAPPWPTTAALKLKLGMGSNPTGTFSSGHLRYELSADNIAKHLWCLYPSILIPFNWLGSLSSAEASFINQVWQVLLHEFFDFGNCFLQTFFCRTGNMQVQRGVLPNN